jgi:hypothetical protein
MSTFTDRERYLFDLNGFIVIRGALDADEVRLLNEAVDANAQLNRREGVLRNTRADSKMSAPGDRFDVGGILSWPEPVFRKLLAHPSIVPYLNSLCGKGYRLDHSPLLLVQEKDSEGFMLHGGSLSGG